MILILEDDPERVARFAAVVADLDPALPVRVWADAGAFVREAGPLLPNAVLVSLDHDLEPSDDCPDPGDGYDAARWLAARPTRVPVVFHTSNLDRAVWMAGAFELAGRKCRRVVPFGDDWVETDWRREVRRALRKRHAA